jgi:hypothetical protein
MHSDILIPLLGCRRQKSCQHKSRYFYFKITLCYWHSCYSAIILSLKYSTIVYCKSTNSFIIWQCLFSNIRPIIFIIYFFWIIYWAWISVKFSIVEKAKTFFVEVSALYCILFFILGISYSYRIHPSQRDRITCL